MSQISLFGEKVTTDKDLKDRYVVPPFSVLDTRQGYWRKRRDYWMSIGIKGELGRDAECLPSGFDEEKYGKKISQGTSVFDPVLCECMYRWFCPNDGVIFDPFAGGSVRGIIASELGFDYYGIDLTEKQIKANREQAGDICDDNAPMWVVGDALDVNSVFPDLMADFIFSCPPYHDLEVYSDDPRDLSNMDYDVFLQTYSEIIKRALAHLKSNRFVCFVVGDVRDKNGRYREFVADTIKCFTFNKNISLYNQMILVNSAGTLPIRTPRMMESTRKIGNMHQHVLVFYKGDNMDDIKELSWCDMCEEEKEDVQAYDFNEPASEDGKGTVYVCDECAGVDDA